MEHHAYLIIGDHVHAFVQVPEVDREAHPDVIVREVERFGVDDARMISLESSRTPLRHTHRISIISTRMLTEEAQNALLKLFEDPTPTARFYLIVPSEGVLLETLRSRLHLLSNTAARRGLETNAAKEFLGAPYAERLALIESHHRRGEHVWFRDVLSGIEARLKSEREPSLLRDAFFVRTRFEQAGASRKMLFEHLALSLPQDW